MNYTLIAKKNYQDKIRELNNNWLPYKNRNILNKKWSVYINSVMFQMIDDEIYNNYLTNYLDDNISNIPLNTFNKIRRLYHIKDEYIKNISIKVLPKYILVNFIYEYFIK